jgi:DMSO/TMAO reductase YedYZ heme-binding membrane subunit
MGQRRWQLLQRFSYLFFGLIFVHILFYLLPPTLEGSSSAAMSLISYSAVGIAYAVLRIRLFLLRRQDALEGADAAIR